MFPKHNCKIDHENIVNMGTTLNYTTGISKEALFKFVGCLDPTEEIKSADLLNLEQRMHMHQIGKSSIEETKSKMLQPCPVSKHQWKK